MTDRPRRGHRDSAAWSLLLAFVVGLGLAVTALANGTSSLTARIELDQEHVSAGGVVGGKLILDNATSASRVLLRGCTTDGSFAIGLRAADGYLQGAAFALVGCSPSQALVIARPGLTIYRFSVRTTYEACLQSPKQQPPQGSANWMPVCLRDARGERDVAPPLPAGEYAAVFLPDGRWQGPVVTPAGLAVTRAR